MEQDVKTDEVQKTPTVKYLCKHTLDGEVLVEITETEEKVYPLKTVSLLPLPESFNESHVSGLRLFHTLLTTIKERHPRREVPVLRNEFFKSGASPKLVRELVRFGLIKEAIIPLLSKNGKNPGSRACLYYTPQGRAFIRDKFDPSYAKTDYE